MATAVSSWRTETYSGNSPAACGRASASQSGAQSEPGEAKMRSTPMAPSTLRIASAPIMPRSFDPELGNELGVAVVLALHVGRKLGGRHRLGELHREGLEPLAHLRLLHQAEDLAVQALDRLARRARGGVEREVRAAVDAVNPVLLERRHIGKIRVPVRSGHHDHAQLPGLRLRQA